MKICFYYSSTQKPWGGSNNFCRLLEQELNQQGINTTKNLNAQYDILFLNGVNRGAGKLLNFNNIHRLTQYGSPHLLAPLLKKKEHRPKILMRLDGLKKIYAGVETDTDRLVYRFIPYLDKAIYQSQFAFELFKQLNLDIKDHSIIHNAIDAHTFKFVKRNPPEPGTPIQIISCSWSSNPNKGHSLIADYSEHPGVEVTFIGNWPTSTPHKKVKIIPPTSHKNIMEYYKGSHIFLFPSKLEACSNTLIEAISSGMPTLYLDSGSNAEIASNFGCPIIEGDISNSINRVLSSYESICSRIENQYDKFTISSVAMQYIHSFKELLKI